MANKEIKITVPEGYEIDKENSTFECIKFKKKAISYKDICQSMADANDGFYYIAGSIITHDDRKDYNNFYIVGAPSYYQMKRIVALNKLMNVAEYLNETTLDWNNDNQTKWYIYYDHEEDVLELGCNGFIQSSNAYFDSETHAKQAVEILGEDTIKCALGVK
jgi:hypothetical protein